VIVDAELAAVDVERAGRNAGRELRKEGRTAEAAIEIFRLQRPVWQEHPLRARARGPTGERLAVADAYTERARAEFGSSNSPAR